jgi:hypothetical protein
MAQHMQPVQYIPEEVQRFAEAHSLGMPTASYSERAPGALGALYSLLFGSLFFLGWFILSLFGSVPGEGWPLLGTAIFGGTTILYYEKLKQQVHVYTEGFVYLRRRKGVALRFAQIKTLWYERAEDVDSLCIRKIDGSELKVRGYILRDSSEIYQTIEREFVRIRLPGMLERYEAGNDIAFGELSVNKLGLTRKGETLPWSQVQSIQVGDLRVWIKKEGQKGGHWFNSRVPNRGLLQALVTQIRSAP